MIRRLQRWLPELTLFLAILSLFYRLLLGEVIFWGTPMLQFYPWQHAAFEMLRAGKLPLWNSLVGHGAPLLANYQTAVFYPANWINLVVPTEYAMGFIGILHLFWAGLGMIAYTRKLGIARIGQGISALAFSLSGYLIGRFGFLSVINAAAWLPWIIWSIESLHSARDSERLNRMLVLAIVISMLLLAGHAQIAFYSLTIAGCYALWLTFSQTAIPWRTRITILLYILAGVILAIALAAIQLVPTFELMQASQRSKGLDAAYGLTYSFWPWRFLSLFSPNLFGSPVTGDYWGYANYWEDAIYIGLLPIVLACRAVVFWIRRSEREPSFKLVPFYILIILAAFFLALGKNNPIFVWMYDHIPGVNMFQGPTRWSILAVFGLAVLASIGASEWKTRAVGQLWSRRTIAVGIGIVISGVAVKLMLQGSVNESLAWGTIRLGIMLIPLAMISLLLRRVERQPKWRAVWKGGVLGLLAVDLVTAHWGLNPTTSASLYHQLTGIVTAIRPALRGARIAYTSQSEYDAKFGEFYSFTDYQANDQRHWQIVRGSLLPNLNMIDGVPSASNSDPLLIGFHDELMQSLDSLSQPNQVALMEQMNIGVLLTTHSQTGLSLIDQYGPVLAYKIPDVWPRASIAVCENREEVLTCHPSDDGSAIISAEQPGILEIMVTTVQSRWLLLLDSYYPGWTASIDNKSSQIVLANGAFRAVSLPPGSHKIQFEYQPSSIRNGAIVSGGALSVVIGLWLSGRVMMRSCKRKLSNVE